MSKACKLSLTFFDRSGNPCGASTYAQLPVVGVISVVVVGEMAVEVGGVSIGDGVPEAPGADKLPEAQADRARVNRRRGLSKCRFFKSNP